MAKTQEELFENDLSEVSGGSGTRSRTVVVSVTLPTDRTDTVDMKVYVDGILDSSLTKSIDPHIYIINLMFKGIQGKTRVDVKINDIFFKTYIVNFDDGSYNIL